MKSEKIQYNPRILFVVNVDWFFLSHRLPLALAARDAGFDVWVAAADTGEGDKIESHGLRFVPIPLSRSGTNIFAEMRNLVVAYRLKRKIKPVLVHHVAIKPVLYGSIVTKLFYKDLPVVNAITGLGFAFSESRIASLFRPLINLAYRFALKNPKSVTVFQNPDNRSDFIRKHMVLARQAIVIKGSGVDVDVFKPSGSLPGQPTIMLASRLIWDKGIATFIEAARIIRASDPGIRFVLLGKPDEGNPKDVPVEQLNQWVEEGVVDWWGFKTNMPQLLNQASIVVLPTFYPEGVPKILIEAASCGKPLIATDRPGCREIVRDGINGLLIPAKDSQALANAILQLIGNPVLMKQFGDAGRKIVIKEFALHLVVDQTLALYKKMLGKKYPGQTHSPRFTDGTPTS